jgi:AraC-like DNA-binding protein
MPLYMDIHKFEEITIEDVKKAHIADVSIQDKYGVKHHQFWVNQEAGLVFCLVEGPDKESCKLVHQLSHGATACNIVEVETGFFKLFMGDGQPVIHGMVQNENGSADPGYRHIMVIDIRAMTSEVRSEDYKQLFIPLKSKNLVLDRIARFNGRVVEKLGDDSLVGVFNTTVNAIRCAKDLHQEFIKRKKNKPGDPEWDISFRIGLSTGQPVTEDAGFFDKALTFTRRLCLAAKDNEVLVSSITSKLCNLEDTSPLRSLTEAEESFIDDLFDYTENNLPDGNFTVAHLSRRLGISRPQLYRKVLSITGHSPNEFISALRMGKAISLIKNHFGNVSEIALEVGYQNPSYFSKCFQKNYGCTPSEFIKIRDSA